MFQALLETIVYKYFLEYKSVCLGARNKYFELTIILLRQKEALEK